MAEGDLRFPEWQLPVQDAILEFNRERLRDKVQKVETLIYERLQQINGEDDGAQDERQSIQDALEILRTIKRDRLGYPDWKKGTSPS
jgi:hypothetical protein